MSKEIRNKYGAKGIKRLGLFIAKYLLEKTVTVSTKISNWCWDTNWNKLKIDERLYPERYDHYHNRFLQEKIKKL
tara:strand:+ start:2544 stop:2768 length:225 start_codon:yes stop_codon:yes gene_type:complete